MHYIRVRARNLESRLVRAGFYFVAAVEADRESSISMGWDAFLTAEYGSIAEAILRLGGESLIKFQTAGRAAGPVMVDDDRVNLPGSMPIGMMNDIFRLAKELVETDYYVDSQLYARLGMIAKKQQQQQLLQGEEPQPLSAMTAASKPVKQ